MATSIKLPMQFAFVNQPDRWPKSCSFPAVFLLEAIGLLGKAVHGPKWYPDPRYWWPRVKLGQKNEKYKQSQLADEILTKVDFDHESRLFPDFYDSDLDIEAEFGEIPVRFIINDRQMAMARQISSIDNLCEFEHDEHIEVFNSLQTLLATAQLRSFRRPIQGGATLEIAADEWDVVERVMFARCAFGEIPAGPRVASECRGEFHIFIEKSGLDKHIQKLTNVKTKNTQSAKFWIKSAEVTAFRQNGKRKRELLAIMQEKFLLTGPQCVSIWTIDAPDNLRKSGRPKKN